MSIDVAVASGRMAAEARMRDTCTITRPGTGTGPFNETTGQYDPPPPVTIYSGKCEAKFQSVAGTQSATAGGTLTTRQQPLVKLPVVGSEAVRINDTVTMNTAGDAALVGRQFQVMDLDFGDNITARRLPCNTVTGG